MPEANLLDSIRVEGFKAIFDSEEVALRPLTLFIGRNGSGKSSLLEALQWIQESMQLGLVAATDARFGSYPDLIHRSLEKPRTTVSLVMAKDTKKEVRYSVTVVPAKLDSHPIVHDESCGVGRKNATQWPISSKKGKYGPAHRTLPGRRIVRNADRLGLAEVDDDAKGVGELRSVFDRAAFLRLSPVALARRDLPRKLPGAPLLDEEGRLTAQLFARLPGAAQKLVSERVGRMLPGVVELGVSEDDRSGVRYFFSKERMKAQGGKKKFHIPSWLLSEGTRRLTAIHTLLALDPLPKLIVIEEIENGLDPWTLREVFSSLREAVASGVQVLLTTHSPFLLDFVEVDEVVHVTRPEGRSNYKPISGYADVISTKGVLPPGAMYLSGFGKPAP